MKYNQSLPSILSVITVSLKDTGIVGFGPQFPDMITDGSWAIRRSALKFTKNMPKFLLEALNAETRDGPLFDVFMDKKTFSQLYACEPATNSIRAIPTMRNGVCAPAMEMQQCGADKKLTVNARYLKLIWELFPACDWAILNDNTIVLAGKDGEIVALLAVVKTK